MGELVSIIQTIFSVCCGVWLGWVGLILAGKWYYNKCIVDMIEES